MFAHGIPDAKRWGRILPRAYMVANLGAGFLSGLAVGYTLEKNNIPYSDYDTGLQLGVPAGLQTLEYTTLDLVNRVTEYRRAILDDEIVGRMTQGNFGALGTFLAGDHLGRLLAKGI